MWSRRKLTGNTRPPKSWYTFLRNNENKTELFDFLADTTVSATIHYLCNKERKCCQYQSHRYQLCIALQPWRSRYLYVPTCKTGSFNGITSINDTDVVVQDQKHCYSFMHLQIKFIVNICSYSPWATSLTWATIGKIK